MLLFDQNISRKILKLLEGRFPNSAHVTELGLVNATDREIWEFAKYHQFTIVSFDVNFYNYSIIWGTTSKNNLD
ncbi:DUF5615 family PIN-like protein [Croceimicrobium sp.]|uniref:DUF5615 family PIN-like protein n=1 Tax=Croceimicrobium sp. TaxID=2828340 RepID=UPI003BAA0520